MIAEIRTKKRVVVCQSDRRQDKASIWPSALPSLSPLIYIDGRIGSRAVKRNVNSWIMATMIVNIISSAIFFPVLITWASIAISVNFSFYCQHYPSICSYASSAFQTQQQCVDSPSPVLPYQVNSSSHEVTAGGLTTTENTVCSLSRCLPFRANYDLLYAAPALQTQQQFSVYPMPLPGHQINSSSHEVTAGGQTTTVLPLQYLSSSMQQQQSPQPQQMLGQQQHVIQPIQAQFNTQSGVTIVTQNPQESLYKLKPTTLSQLKRLSITQIVVGGLCLLLGISILVVEAESRYSSELSFTGYGIWCGVYFVLAGGIGLGAVKHNTYSWIMATMILNIISSAIFFPALISMASIVIGGKKFTSYCKQYSSACPIEKAAIVLSCGLLLFSVAELVITIWSAVLCCEAVCSCCLSARPNHQVQYAVPALQTQQQYVVYPGTVLTQHVNSSGYQVTTGHQTPTATTLMLPQGSYILQSQQPPTYYQIVQATPNQISGNEQSPASADTTSN
ncbi:uncharacterized protein [Watersipora subatra]|uniref:uncharacterized protein n=1 Tax=Watersipora subatra TaxID=2589382 RepID=UPI00355B35C9